MWQLNYVGFFDRFLIVNCNKVILLQNASGITKCDKLLLQKVAGIAKCDRLYYKVGQVLQSVKVITKWDVTHFLYLSFRYSHANYVTTNIQSLQHKILKFLHS